MPSRSTHKYLFAAAALLIFWLGIRYILPLIMPFLLASALALIAEPLVRVFQQRLHLSRNVSSGIGISICLLLTVLLLISLCAFLLKELGELAGILPDLEETAADGIASLEGFFVSLANKAPSNVSSVVTRSVENLFSGSSQVLDQVTGKLLNVASGILKALPDSALGLGTWVLASFMTSAKLPQIKTFFRRRLPDRWRQEYLPALKKLRHSLGGWLTAQLKLTGITFCVLTLGFILLQISYAPLWAALISLVDALPILGTGTVLLPWSLVCFLQGDSLQAVGLLGTYAAAALLRSILEPKLVGRQLGLDPLVTLMALYAGYRIWGILGMLVAPLLAVTLTQLFVKPSTDNNIM